MHTKENKKMQFIAEVTVFLTYLQTNVPGVDFDKRRIVISIRGTLSMKVRHLDRDVTSFCKIFSIVIKFLYLFRTSSLTWTLNQRFFRWSRSMRIGRDTRWAKKLFTTRWAKKLFTTRWAQKLLPQSEHRNFLPQVRHKSFSRKRSTEALNGRQAQTLLSPCVLYLQKLLPQGGKKAFAARSENKLALATREAISSGN